MKEIKEIKENNKKNKEIPLQKFCITAKQMDKDNEYYIIRKNDNLVYNLGKIINYDLITEIERFCWHDGPIYKVFYYVIEFENMNKIDDLELIDSFKKLDSNGMVYITYNYSNLFII
jgi:hypothetical protein